MGDVSNGGAGDCGIGELLLLFICVIFPPLGILVWICYVLSD